MRQSHRHRAVCECGACNLHDARRTSDRQSWKPPLLIMGDAWHRVCQAVGEMGILNRWVRTFMPSRKMPQEPVQNVDDFLRELITVAPPAGGGHYNFPDAQGGSRGFVQFIIRSDRRVIIHRLWTHKAGAGNGGHILQTLCDLADRHTVELMLKPLPIGRKPYPMSRDQLQKWYERYGFLGTRKRMIRAPQLTNSEVATNGALETGR